MPSLSCVWKIVEEKIHGMEKTREDGELAARIAASMDRFRKAREDEAIERIKSNASFDSDPQIFSGVKNAWNDVLPSGRVTVAEDSGGYLKVAIQNQLQFVICDYCGALTELRDGCCTHCGGGISLEKIQNTETKYVNRISPDLAIEDCRAFDNNYCGVRIG